LRPAPLAFVLLPLLLGGCGGAGPARAPAAPRADAPSLFAEPWVWVDEQGARVSFAAWRGNPILVTMVFTDCTSACPLTIEKLRRANEELAREGRAATFVLVTLDPTSDTPEQLRRFKDARHLPAAWHLLRGSDEQTRRLADLLQIHVVDNAHIFHDTRIVVFDAEGRLAGQLHG
jgi:protein SCO1/2